MSLATFLFCSLFCLLLLPLHLCFGSCYNCISFVIILLLIYQWFIFEVVFLLTAYSLYLIFIWIDSFCLSNGIYRSLTFDRSIEQSLVNCFYLFCLVFGVHFAIFSFLLLDYFCDSIFLHCGLLLISLLKHFVLLIILGVTIFFFT